jgi:hypothetical protein
MAHLATDTWRVPVTTSRLEYSQGRGVSSMNAFGVSALFDDCEEVKGHSRGLSTTDKITLQFFYDS